MFDSTAYGEEIARILALGENGEHLMPLRQGKCTSDTARDLIARAKLPDLVRAGLYLYFSCWNEAHEAAQDVDTPDGSYWHGIVHRQEPDAGNAGYWFDRVGRHPIFPALLVRSVAYGFDPGPEWDPLAFVTLCERAKPGTGTERIALDVQRAEWQLLFDHCAR
jgi:hypothetical protein